MDDRERARRQLAELATRGRRRTRLDPHELLFAPQLGFVTDKSEKVAAVCSRRAGKSFGIAFKLLEAGFAHPRAIVPYITQTRETAKDIIWAPMFELDERLELGLQFRENDGTVVLPNKAKIVLRGAGTRREIDKLRGGKHPLVAIDEAQGFGTATIDYLIDEVVEPALLDYRGQLLLTGTPNAACAGYFHAATEKGRGGWSVHRWTMLDNPHLPDPKSWLEKKRKQNNWPLNHPKYLREYCGVWVRDSEGLVYSFRRELNVIPSFSTGDAPDWEYILGIDLGFNDPTAFVILAYSEYLGKAVVVHSWKESGLRPSRVAAEVERLMQEYRFSRIVADSGGFGKGYVEEMKEKHGIPVIAARKRDKAAFVEMLNSDLASGTLLIGAENEDLIDEIELLQWDSDKLETSGKLVEDGRFSNHLTDALLYAWRECHHHTDEREFEGPTRGTAEWFAAQEAHELEQAMRQFGESGEPWWESGMGSGNPLD